jgi:uncharacterized protein
MVTSQRRDEVRRVLGDVCHWGARHADIRGVMLVGSWARDAARVESDVDIIVLTDTTVHADSGPWTCLLDGPGHRRTAVAAG